jgi:hypothetical protein
MDFEFQHYVNLNGGNIDTFQDLTLINEHSLPLKFT